MKLIEMILKKLNKFYEKYRVWEQLKRRSSFQVLPTMDNQKKPTGTTRDLNHPAFQNIRVCLVSFYKYKN